jgi:hypothetical protein
MADVEQLKDGDGDDLAGVVAALRQQLIAVQEELAAMRVAVAPEARPDRILSRRQLFSRLGSATFVGMGLPAVPAVPAVLSSPAAFASDASDASGARGAKARPSSSARPMTPASRPRR